MGLNQNQTKLQPRSHLGESKKHEHTRSSLAQILLQSKKTPCWGNWLVGLHLRFKILCIGSAEQNWKKMKKLISGDQSNAWAEVAKKQAIIAWLHMQEKNKQDHSKKATAGLLWSSLTNIQFVFPQRTARVFGAGLEKWKSEPVKGKLGSCTWATFQKQWFLLKWLWSWKKQLIAYIQSEFCHHEKGVNRKSSSKVFACLKGYDGIIPNDEHIDKWEVPSTLYCAVIGSAPTC